MREFHTKPQAFDILDTGFVARPINAICLNKARKICPFPIYGLRLRGGEPLPDAIMEHDMHLAIDPFCKVISRQICI